MKKQPLIRCVLRLLFRPFIWLEWRFRYFYRCMVLCRIGLHNWFIYPDHPWVRMCRHCPAVKPLRLSEGR